MMEYNNYYPVQPGQPPAPPNMMASQPPDCSSIGGQMMTPNGPPMMQPSPAPSTPQSMRQTPGPPPMQMHQHMGPGQQMHQQPSPHPIYHQLPQHPPISHSASPHPSSTPHAQQPPPRPSTGPSPLHQQSPIHLNGPSPKLHSVGPLGPPSQPQTPGVLGPPPPNMHGQAMPVGSSGINHHLSHNYGGSPMPHHSSPHYGHSPMNPHQQNPPHHAPAMHHHGGPPIPQSGPQHPAMMGRGPQAHGSMPMHPQPPPPGYMMSPHPPPPPMHHHQHHHSMGGVPPPLERGSPFYQQIPQTEFRIIELNKRLQSRPRPMGPPRTLPIDEFDESRWWKQFACDFFDDDAFLTLRIPSEDKQTEYTIGRTMIPRFFKSYFDGGVMDYSIKLRNIRETTHQPGFITLDCDQTDITTKNFYRHQGGNPPSSVVVHTEGHLIVDFVSSFDNLLIKSWRFYSQQCHEYVDRSMTNVGPYIGEPVTRFGLTKNTFAFLKMCMIMEPMQDLMIHHRQTNMRPRACLKQLLFDRYKVKNADDNPAQPNKRRRRKTAANGGPTGGNTKKAKANSNGAGPLGNPPMSMGNNMMQPDVGGNMIPNLPLASQDVLVVGEPSMLGADFGDENERRITRLENNQFDPSTSLDTIGDNNTMIKQQQITDNGGDNGQQIDGNPMCQNNLISQQQAPQPQQQQQQQQQTTVSNNDPINQTIPDQQHQQQPQQPQQNILQNHNSFRQPNCDEDVSSMMNYNPVGGDQNDNMMTNQCNSEEQHNLNELNLGNPGHSQDMQRTTPHNCNNNNNNNQMNSFMMNQNDSHVVKSEVDLKQQSQQQQQQQQQPQHQNQHPQTQQQPQQHPTMTAPGPTPVTEAEAS